VDLRAELDDMEQVKVLALRVIELRSLDRPARGLPLHRPRYRSSSNNDNNNIIIIIIIISQRCCSLKEMLVA
jgi:hypothetical protein